jgi:hypothetical protein
MEKLELYVGDEFELIVNKPKSTVGKKYIIFRKEQELDRDTIYWYYNDNDQLEQLFKNEYL